MKIEPIRDDDPRLKPHLWGGLDYAKARVRYDAVLELAEAGDAEALRELVPAAEAFYREARRF